jgi:hypothetical protein
MKSWVEAFEAAGGGKAGEAVAVKVMPMPFLILVPAILVRQWAEEIHDFADLMLRAFIYHGGTRMRSVADHHERIYDVLTPDSRQLRFYGGGGGGGGGRAEKPTPRINVIVCSHET